MPRVLSKRHASLELSSLRAHSVLMSGDTKTRLLLSLISAGFVGQVLGHPNFSSVVVPHVFVRTLCRETRAAHYICMSHVTTPSGALLHSILGCELTRVHP
ncbi:hypothetical protein BJX76DRAFT_319565 [Aspergillus varians]